jgi:tRNA pseudouridine38-40 synthase
LNGLLDTNKHGLAGKISVYRVEDAAANFNARYLAKAKHYRYQLWYGFAEHAFITPQCWHVRAAKNYAPEGLQHLGEILKPFAGKHNFNAFRANDCGAKNTVCEIFKITCHPNEKFPEHTIVDIWGNRFLKNMIRYMVGTAVQVAVGKRPLDTISQALATGLPPERSPLRAPGHGLSLMEVFFEKEGENRIYG